MLDFDENWYLANNLDLALYALRDPGFDPYRHYRNHGQFEGRLPAPPTGFYNRIFSYGAYGSNNLGDEAILQGVRTFYPGCISLHLFKSSDEFSVEYNVPLHTPGFFKKNDYLILGGGGLLYSRENVVYMRDLARTALAAGAFVDILRLGCEAASADYKDEISELFSLPRFISVRSTTSVQIIKDLIGKDVVYQRDFAFFLSGLVKKPCDSTVGFKRIGVSLGSIDDYSLSTFAAQLSKFLLGKHRGKFRFIFFPHSQSYFDFQNNDNVTFHKLWSLLSDVHRYYDDALSLLPFCDSVQSLLERYSILDGFVGARYHSLIFSTIFDLPTIALASGQAKNKSFLIDNPRRGFVPCDDLKDLDESMNILFCNRD